MGRPYPPCHRPGGLRRNYHSDARCGMEKQILLIEDEKAIADILEFNLQKEGYRTAAAYDGEEGLRMALTGEYDIILLDVMLPKMDGWEICRRVRAELPTPVLMLTAREDETDKVRGLGLGADDYITKPFSMKELMARVKAHLRRSEIQAGLPVQQQSSQVVRVKELVIDNERYMVTKRGEPVDLSSREFALLSLLAANRGKIFSREELMEQVWRYESFYGDLRAVDVMVRRLREKLEDDPSNPSYIQTKRGLGYYFD